MKCPMCGNDLRQSETDPHWGLCDSCKVKFEWKDDCDDYADIATNFSMTANDYAIETEDGYGYQEIDIPVKRRRRKKHIGAKVILIFFAVLCVIAFGAFAFLVGLSGSIEGAITIIRSGELSTQDSFHKSAKSSRTIADIEKYLLDQGVLSGQRTELAASMIGAEQGFKYADSNVEIYCFDISSEAYKKLKAGESISIEGMEGYSFKAIAINGKFVLFASSGATVNKAIIDAFKDFE